MTNNMDGDSIEKVLSGSFSPVKPRREFVGKLLDELEDEVLPLQKRTTISFQELIENIKITLMIIVVSVILIRAVLLFISTLEVLRRNPRPT